MATLLFFIYSVGIHLISVGSPGILQQMSVICVKIVPFSVDLFPARDHKTVFWVKIPGIAAVCAVGPACTGHRLIIKPIFLPVYGLPVEFDKTILIVYPLFTIVVPPA